MAPPNNTFFKALYDNKRAFDTEVRRARRRLGVNALIQLTNLYQGRIPRIYAAWNVGFPGHAAIRGGWGVPTHWLVPARGGMFGGFGVPGVPQPVQAPAAAPPPPPAPAPVPAPVPVAAPPAPPAPAPAQAAPAPGAAQLPAGLLALTNAAAMMPYLPVPAQAVQN